MTVPNLAYLVSVGGLAIGRIPTTGLPTRDIESWRVGGWDGGHLHCFTKGQLGDFLDSLGFEPEAWTGDGKFARLRRWYINFVGNLTVRARRRTT